MNEKSRLTMVVGSLFLLTAFLVTKNANAFAAGDFPASVVGNRATFGSGTIGGGSLGSGALSVASDGTILAKGPVSFLPGGGLAVEAQLATRIGKPAITAALGRFFVKSLPAVGLALAVYDLARELGYGVHTENNLPVFTRDEPGYTYSVGGASTVQNATGPSPGAACSKTIDNNYAKTVIVQNVTSGAPYGVEYICHVLTGANANQDFFIFKAATSIAQVPITVDEVVSSVLNKPVWLSTSPLSDVLQKATESGEVIPATPEVLTGPATSPPVSTTVQTPSGSTVTTTTNNYNYGGPTVTVTTTTNIQNLDKFGLPVGPPVSSTKDGVPLAVTPSEPKKDPATPAVDTDLPAQPKLYKKIYPDGISGVWRTQTDSMANSPLFTLGKQLMPQVSANGSCPTMNVNLNIARWSNFGTHDFAPPCQVWDWGKAIVIVSSLLLARRLIFGG